MAIATGVRVGTSLQQRLHHRLVSMPSSLLKGGTRANKQRGCAPFVSFMKMLVTILVVKMLEMK